uniref:Uncharacterized protein n=1 Tax=Rhodnius prolixus TaxID=13249 RepID=T1HJS1_RHOPR
MIHNIIYCITSNIFNNLEYIIIKYWLLCCWPVKVCEEDTRLEGKEETVGGLIIKKKPVPQGNFEFKIPKPSLLGLDRLAALRRKERNAHDDKDSKKTKSDGGDDGVFKKPEVKKHYREKTDETPTHTGGVTREARDRIAQRSKD